MPITADDVRIGTTVKVQISGGGVNVLLGPAVVVGGFHEPVDGNYKNGKLSYEFALLDGRVYRIYSEDIHGISEVPPAEKINLDDVLRVSRSWLRKRGKHMPSARIEDLLDA